MKQQDYVRLSDLVSRFKEAKPLHYKDTCDNAKLMKHSGTGVSDVHLGRHAMSMDTELFVRIKRLFPDCPNIWQSKKFLHQFLRMFPQFQITEKV